MYFNLVCDKGFILYYYWINNCEIMGYLFRGKKNEIKLDFLFILYINKKIYIKW